MHILFMHQNYPAQFGQIASYLVRRHGHRCSFVTNKGEGTVADVQLIPYKLAGGASEHNHFCSRTFENTIWHSHGVYQALKARPDIRPDLIVGHSGFASTIFLRELYDCPIINYFEYFYRTKGSDMDFRPEFATGELERLRAGRNAALLLDLENCDAGYSPTRWQRDRLPKIFHDKIEVIFDGIDTTIWTPRRGLPRRLGNTAIPDDMRVISYVARGMESMRGFDIFMKAARLICQRRKDVLFVVVGQDRVCYGGDERFTGGLTFKEWVLRQDDYDLSRFLFTGLLPPSQLALLLAWTDLHIYLTVPFVLSWSLLNALSCGAPVLASRTAPVEEIIRDGHNGLLIDFFDIEGIADQACRVLDAPGDFRALGAAGAEMVCKEYSLDVCLPRMLQLYERVLNKG